MEGNKKYYNKPLYNKPLYNKPLYNKPLSEPWFTLIKDGIKLVEGRPNKGDFAKMKIGDLIKFFNNRREFIVEIIDKKYYKSFREMLEIETLEKVLPDEKIKTIEDGISVYRKWYNEELEKKFGVVAIHVKIYTQN